MGNPHPSAPRFTTARLLLEPHHPEADFPAFHRMATNPEVMRYITSGIPFTEKHSRDFLTRQPAHLEAHGYCRWKLTLRTTGEYAGLCGAEVKMLDGEKVPELGWWIAPQLWGQGYATEAAEVALEHLWEQVRLPRLTSCAYPENTASIRVMEKLGLIFEKHFWEDSPYTQQRLLLVMYSRTR
ncbi:MAG: GNAT family N-acetyltransferase [Bryobacterales bacterium]|nr:GNAT family N-acetyltransferase [Bryobacterales bacterium]